MPMNFDKLTRGSVPVPLYYQAKTRFSDFIRSGNLKPGDIIPPEQTLCSELGVSRGTVRKAIGGTSARGRIETGAGKGNFYRRSETGSESPRLFQICGRGYVERNNSRVKNTENRKRITAPR